jgi:hypothetical protein
VEVDNQKKEWRKAMAALFPEIFPDQDFCNFALTLQRCEFLNIMFLLLVLFSILTGILLSCFLKEEVKSLIPSKTLYLRKKS